MPLENFFKSYFGLKDPKDHSRRMRGGGEVASAFVFKSMCPFTSQKCSFIPRITLSFSRIALLFYFYFSFYCAFLFPRMLFSCQLNLLLVLLRAAQRCTLDILTWSMIFDVFYSNFSLHDSLENAVSEHLGWLKPQKIYGGSTPKPYSGRGAHSTPPQHPLDPSGVLSIAYDSAKIRCL